MLQDYIAKRGLSVYAVAKGSHLPYSTVNELVLGKKSVQNCNVKTLSALADYFALPLDSFYDQILLSSSPIKLATTWEDAKGKAYSFPTIVKDSAIPVHRFHPLKQKQIFAIYQAAKLLPQIKAIVIFGSATTIRCGKDSDIDICIELQPEAVNNETKNRVSELLQEACNYNADILWKDHIKPDSHLDQNIQ